MHKNTTNGVNQRHVAGLIATARSVSPDLPLHIHSHVPTCTELTHRLASNLHLASSIRPAILNSPMPTVSGPLDGAPCPFSLRPRVTGARQWKYNHRYTRPGSLCGIATLLYNALQSDALRPKPYKLCHHTTTNTVKTTTPPPPPRAPAPTAQTMASRCCCTTRCSLLRCGSS
jgi:hypothetical protein